MKETWTPARALDCTIAELIHQEEDLNTATYRRVLFRALALAGKMRVLDAGCGTGFLVRVIARQAPGCLVYGVDLDAETLRVAELLANQAGVRPLFLQGDVTRLEFADGFFDRVACQLLLCNLAKPMEALIEMWRVLCPGGRLVCVEPVNGKTIVHCAYAPWADAMRERRARELQRLTAAGVDLDLGRRLPELLARCGLEDIQVAGCMKVSAGVGFVPLQRCARVSSLAQLSADLVQVFGRPIASVEVACLYQAIRSDPALVRARAAFGSLIVTPLIVASGVKTR